MEVYNVNISHLIMQTLLRHLNLCDLTTHTMVGWGTESKIILLFVLLSFWFVFDFGHQIFQLTSSLFICRS